MTRLSALTKQIRLLTAELRNVDFGEEDFLPDDVEIANRTSRSQGAVGAKAVVPRVVREWIQPSDKVLDFGAGKDAAHAQRLRAEGFNVVAHEFGKNQQPDLHDPNALQGGPYDMAYASNVLNVQSSPVMMQRTLVQIRRALKPGGIFIANFPKQPRKSGMTPAEVAAKISEVFGVDAMTVKPGGMPKAGGRVPAEPIFFVRYKGFKGAVPTPGATTMASKTSIAVKAASRALAGAAKLTAAKLTKEHFIAIADAIALLSKKEDRILILNALLPMLQASNPAFDVARFSRAAKVTGDDVAANVKTTYDDWDDLPKKAQELLAILGEDGEMSVESFEGFGFTLKDAGPLEAGGLIKSLGVDGWMVTRQGKYVAEDNKNRKPPKGKRGVRGSAKVKAGHMEPQVFKGDVLVVETDDGTSYIPGDDAKKLMVDTRNSSPEEVNTAVAEFLGLDDGDVSEVSIEKGKWLARSSAPGYMDQTDYSMFDSEEEAWEYLIDMDPSLFTWTVELTASEEEGGTAHIYMASDAAAKAMQKAVQSVGGAKLERDGDFVYAPLSGNGDDVMKDLDGMGFTTEEG